MTQKQTRKLIDFAITVSTAFVLYIAGAGLWVLILAPYAFWNFYDGMTRHGLR
jgi:hypothetical protein